MDFNYTSIPVATIPDLRIQNHNRSMFVPTVFAILLALGVVVVYSRGETKSTADNSEPPVLQPRVPFIGHLIGMLRWQVGYMQMLRYVGITPLNSKANIPFSSKCPSWPAFTLRIGASRVYVICDPSLIQAAYRNTKAFDFGSFVVEAAERLFEISEQGMKIMRGETAPGYDPNGPLLNGNNGDSFLNEDHKLMVETLSPGPALMELKTAVLDRVAGSLNGMGDSGKFGMYRWMRDVLTIASAEAIYGPENPFSNDLSLVDALWYVYSRIGIRTNFWTAC